MAGRGGVVVLLAALLAAGAPGGCDALATLDDLCRDFFEVANLGEVLSFLSGRAAAGDPDVARLVAWMNSSEFRAVNDWVWGSADARGLYRWAVRRRVPVDDFFDWLYGFLGWGEFRPASYNDKLNGSNSSSNNNNYNGITTTTNNNDDDDPASYNNNDDNQYHHHHHNNNSNNIKKKNKKEKRKSRPKRSLMSLVEEVQSLIPYEEVLAWAFEQMASNQDMTVLMRKMQTESAHAVWRRLYRSPEFRSARCAAIVEEGFSGVYGREQALCGFLGWPQDDCQSPRCADGDTDASNGP